MDKEKEKNHQDMEFEQMMEQRIRDNFAAPNTTWKSPTKDSRK